MAGCHSSVVAFQGFDVAKGPLRRLRREIEEEDELGGGEEDGGVGDEVVERDGLGEEEPVGLSAPPGPGIPVSWA